MGKAEAEGVPGGAALRCLLSVLVVSNERAKVTRTLLLVGHAELLAFEPEVLLVLPVYLSATHPSAVHGVGLAHNSFTTRRNFIEKEGEDYGISGPAATSANQANTQYAFISQFGALNSR